MRSPDDTVHLLPTPTSLPLLLSPASSPPVRRPRQRPLPNQWTRRTSATAFSRPAPSAARPNVFCFGSRAQRCRGHLTGDEEAGDRRRLGDASPPTSPTSDEGVGRKGSKLIDTVPLIQRRGFRSWPRASTSHGGARSPRLPHGGQHTLTRQVYQCLCINNFRPFFRPSFNVHHFGRLAPM